MPKPTRTATMTPEEAEAAAHERETVGKRLEGLLREVIELAKDYGVKVAIIDSHATTLDQVLDLLKVIASQNAETAARAVAASARAATGDLADRGERADKRKLYMDNIVKPLVAAIAALLMAATAWYFGGQQLPVPPVPVQPSIDIEVHDGR